MLKNILNFVISLNRNSKKIILITCDIFILITSYLLSMYLRLDSFLFLSNFDFWITIFLLIPVYIIGLKKIGLYENLTRYISSKIFQRMSIILLLLSFCSLILIIILNFDLPRSLPFISFFISLIGISYLRLLIKYIFEIYTKEQIVKIVIYGVNNKGIQLSKALEQSALYKVEAFFDDDENNIIGNKIDNIKILSAQNNINFLKKNSIKNVLISPDFNPIKDNIDRIIRESSIILKKAPDIETILNSSNDNYEFKKFTISDFLGRKQISPKKHLMKKNLFNQNVFISGAGGSIGSELCLQIIKEKPKKIILCESSEFALFKINKLLNDINQSNQKTTIIKPYLASIQNKEALKAIFNFENINTVYHAAAYKHVNLLEQNSFEAINNNVFGTKNLIDISLSSNIKSFTLISTDKAVRPSSIMGASKRIAELLCQNESKNPKNIKFSIVRFGNVLDTSGSVIPIFNEQIKKGGPVTVTHKDVVRYFMTKKEAAQLVIQASGLSFGGETFVLDMGEPIKILDLAKKMIFLQGFNPILNKPKNDQNEKDMEITFTGLKKGEKMFEELFINNKYSKTNHPRIFSTTEINLKPNELNSILKNLKKLYSEKNLGELINYLKKIPIDYQ